MRIGRLLLIVVFFFFLEDYIVYAQDDIDIVADSIAIDTPVESDSIIFYTPFALHNRLGNVLVPDIVLNKSDLTFLSAGDIGELISDYRNDAYLYPSNWAYKSSNRLFGSLPGYHAVGINGAQLFSATNSAININQLSVDQFENIEIYKGSKAAVLSENNQIFINYQQRVFNTAAPYTSISYFDAGENFISGDGLFSQNILPNQNLYIGFKSFGGGTEYESQLLDNMNIFLSYRFNTSEFSSLSISYSYINQFMQDNGGIVLTDQTKPYVSTNEFDPSTAEYLDPEFNLRELNHILQFDYSQSFDNDTTFVLNSNLTYLYNDYQVPIYDSIAGNQYPSGSIISTRQIITTKINESDISFGFDGRLALGMNENFYRSGFSPFGYLNLDLIGFQVGVGARGNFSNQYNNINYGGSLGYKIDTLSAIEIDLSFNNINQLNPLSLVNSFTVGSVIASYVLQISNNTVFSLEGFYHSYSQYHHAISGQVTNGMDNLGSQANFVWPIYMDFVFSNSDLYLSTTAKVEKFSILDDISFEAQVDLFSEIKVAESVARLGLRSSYLRNMNPFFFDSYAQLYYLNPYEPVNTILLDAYLMAKLGNANVRLVFENILSERYLPVIPYPNRGSNFRIHLSWAFPFY